MVRRIIRPGMILVCILAIEMGCSIPRTIWPQKDAAFTEVNDPSRSIRILIASRDSEYKNAVVKRLRDYYSGKPLFIRIVGLGQLGREKAQDYACIVILNTCMAWGIDPAATEYIEANPWYYRFIVFTTSISGTWSPKIDHEEVDTISAASIMANVDEKSQRVASKIDAFLREDAEKARGTAE